jgi:hypothetical protein
LIIVGLGYADCADEHAELLESRLVPAARIAALERLVGKQALELEFLKGAQRLGPRPRNAPMCVIAGPAASPSRKDAD